MMNFAESPIGGSTMHWNFQIVAVCVASTQPRRGGRQSRRQRARR